MNKETCKSNVLKLVKRRPYSILFSLAILILALLFLNDPVKQTDPVSRKLVQEGWRQRDLISQECHPKAGFYEVETETNGFEIYLSAEKLLYSNAISDADYGTVIACNAIADSKNIKEIL